MGAGRPSDFKPEYVQEAAPLLEAGYTDQELADHFKVSRRTLYSWRAAHPEFLLTNKNAKAKADERVERSLFERATGYEHDDVDIRVVEGQIVTTTVRKYYPPDTAAAFIWLKNRAGWKDRQEITGAEGKDLVPALNPQDVAREIAFVLAQAAEKKE